MKLKQVLPVAFAMLSLGSVPISSSASVLSHGSSVLSYGVAASAADPSEHTWLEVNASDDDFTERVNEMAQVDSLVVSGNVDAQATAAILDAFITKDSKLRILDFSNSYFVNNELPARAFDLTEIINEPTFTPTNAIRLSHVMLPTSCWNIGERAFYGCANLRQVDLPDKLMNIGNEAFAFSGVEELSMPVSVTGMSLAGMDNLKKLYCYPTVPPALADGSSELPDDLEVYVPSEFMYRYEGAKDWTAVTDFRSLDCILAQEEISVGQILFNDPKSENLGEVGIVFSSCFPIPYKYPLALLYESGNDRPVREVTLIQDTSVNAAKFDASFGDYFLEEGRPYSIMLPAGAFVEGPDRKSTDRIVIHIVRTAAGKQMTTGVDLIHENQEEVTLTYDLLGRPVNNPAANSGLYIINGKKVLIRK